MVYIKKKTIAGVAFAACVVLCAAVWPWSAEVEDLSAEPVKTAVSAEIEARSEEISQILFSADASALETKAISKNEPQIIEVTTEKETAPPTAPTSYAVSKSAPTSTEPKPGARSVIDGKLHVWIPGFGWVVDEGGGSVGTMVGNPGDKLTGNKVGIMGGGTAVYGKGDINKQVGIMGGGTVAEDMYENGNKIGIMGGDECPSNTPASLPAEQPEITGNVIYAPIQPPVTKDSTPPAYKPNGEPYNP
jgi:hypothetical protein